MRYLKMFGMLALPGIALLAIACSSDTPPPDTTPVATPAPETDTIAIAEPAAPTPVPTVQPTSTPTLASEAAPPLPPTEIPAPTQVVLAAAVAVRDPGADPGDSRPYGDSRCIPNTPGKVRRVSAGRRIRRDPSSGRPPNGTGDGYLHGSGVGL